MSATRPDGAPEVTEPGLVPGLMIHGSHVVTFNYLNYRRSQAHRRVGIISVWFGSTEWHPEPQWLLHGIDLEKMETRDFAMKDMSDVQVAPA